MYKRQVLNKDYWNQGLATEATKAVIALAFEQLGMNKLIAVHDKDCLLYTSYDRRYCSFYGIHCYWLIVTILFARNTLDQMTSDVGEDVYKRQVKYGGIVVALWIIFRTIFSDSIRNADNLVGGLGVLFLSLIHI